MITVGIKAQFFCWYFWRIYYKESMQCGNFLISLALKFLINRVDTYIK